MNDLLKGVTIVKRGNGDYAYSYKEGDCPPITKFVSCSITDVVLWSILQKLEEIRMEIPCESNIIYRCNRNN